MSPRLEGRQSGRRPPEFVLSLTEARTAAAALDSAIGVVVGRLIPSCPDCRPNVPCPAHRQDLALARECRSLRAGLGALLPRPDDKWGGVSR
jgi:hypothetical protein